MAVQPPNTRLKLTARVHYGNGSFFSAPQLTRGPVGAAMRKLCPGILIVIALGAPAQVAEGQRLTPGFPTADATPAFTNAAIASANVGLRYQPPECRLPPVLRVAAGGLGGAAGGWLAYELTLGIWVKGETDRAAPDATFRRIRSTLIVTGAIIGVVRAAHVPRQCRSD